MAEVVSVLKVLIFQKVKNFDLLVLTFKVPNYESRPICDDHHSRVFKFQILADRITSHVIQADVKIYNCLNGASSKRAEILEVQSSVDSSLIRSRCTTDCK